MIIAPIINTCLDMLKLGEILFRESQLKRMASLSSYKDAGECLIQLRDLLSSAKPTKPCETEFGSFKSFNHFLKEKCTELLGIERRSAYRYMTLAENWDIVLKLDMQNVSEETLGNSMRICRTLDIIAWYKKKVKAGADASTLTLDLYWAEQKSGKDKKASQPYDELRKERDFYLKERDYYKERCEILEEQLAAAIA